MSAKYGGAHSSAQVSLAKSSILEKDGLPFKDAFSSDAVQKVMEAEAGDFRDRLFPP